MKWTRYTKYKPLTVEWLGDMPEHWEVRRLKYSTNLINIKVNGAVTALPYTGLEHVESWTGRRLELRHYLAKVLRACDEGICISIAFLDCEKARINGLIEKIQESLEKLREYRAALISAAVTGKIDVRQEVAA